MPSSDIALRCQCGAVKGVVTNATSASGTRVVCCCSDCQQFAEYLGRSDSVLDKFGGTDIYQISQSQVTLQEGAEHLRCVRLAQKGLIRWYADCCKTPIGNTMNGSMPFVGIIHSFIATGDREQALGKVRAYVQLQHAKGDPDYPGGAQKFPPGITLRIIWKMIGWKIRGQNRPSVFFNSDGEPVSEPSIAG